MNEPLSQDPQCIFRSGCADPAACSACKRCLGLDTQRGSAMGVGQGADATKAATEPVRRPDSLPEEEHDSPLWYRRVVNVLASVLLFFIWRGASLVMAHWYGQTEDHWFLAIVAATVALNLPSRRKA